MTRLGILLKDLLIRFDDDMQELLRGAALAFTLKVLAAGLAFGLNVVLARLLGADGSGIFFLAFTVVLITATIGQIGMENVLVRFIAAYSSIKKYGEISDVYKRAITYSLVTAILLTCILYFASSWIGRNIFNKIELGEPLRYLSLSILPLALLNLHAFALQGLKKIAASISVLSIFVPLITGVIAFLFVPSFGINAAIAGYFLATLITLIMGMFFWKKAMKTWIVSVAEVGNTSLLSTSVPLLFVNVMNLMILWAPMIFLGAWGSNADVGIYNAASRTAMLTSFILIAVNTIATPKFAVLYHRGDMVALANLAVNSSKIMILFASPVLFLFLFFPEWVFLLFGKGFQSGAAVLSILAVGQFVNVATGSVGGILMMSGNEKVLRNILVFCTLISMALNFVLVRHFGLIGAAVSSAVSVSLINLISVVWVWKNLNIMTIPWLMNKTSRTNM